ncbi:MAG: ABC transporter ATP-binding protein [Euryarchaeota archaeon]|nr:ABC transporter ATP-binding protein [Euryarchaeota archaeon]
MLDVRSLDIASGERVLLAGASGSGKSTLLMAIAGLFKSDAAAAVEGHIRLDGVDAGKRSRETARRVGFLFQESENQFLAEDVESELILRDALLGLPKARADVHARAASSGPGSTGATRYERLSNLGLDAFADRRIDSLSGGESRRAALACLPGSAPLLLLDEPLNGLDAHWRKRILGDIGTRSADATVIIAEHRWRDVMPHVERVVALHEGVVVFDGRPSVFMGRTAATEAARGRVHGAWDARARGKGPVAEGPHGLQIAGLEVSLDGFSLGPIDLSLGRGVTMLLGDNGSGKTTLLRCLAGFVRPNAGNITLEGKPLAPLESGERARQVGLVTQRAADMLFSPTVAEELAFGPENLGVPGSAAALVEALALEPLLDRHPASLSGGERQRAAIAAALAHDPAVHLFDEPTVGLDAKGFAGLSRLIERARSDHVVVIATHDDRLFPLADASVHLESGRLERRPEVVPAR